MQRTGNRTRDGHRGTGVARRPLRKRQEVWWLRRAAGFPQHRPRAVRCLLRHGFDGPGGGGFLRTRHC